MTIAERKVREAYDRENPWRPISEATPNGMICQLRRADLIDFGTARFFLHEDGRWFQIEPPGRCYDAMEFRPVGTTLSPARRASVIRREEAGTHEYRGGKLFRKPKPYKLHWRADD